MYRSPKNSYYEVETRPRKREVQANFYKIIGDHYDSKPIIMADLPGLNWEPVLEMYETAHLWIKRWLCFEQDETVEVPDWFYKANIIEYLIEKPFRRQIDVFNFDFCNAFGASYNVFKIPYLLKANMADEAFLILTFNPRGPSKITEKVNIMIEHVLPSYGVDVVSWEKASYRDTSAMRSYLLRLRRCDAA